MLCIRCSSALISIPGSNLPFSEQDQGLGHNQLHLAAALVTERCFHTWMSSDSLLTGPLIHNAPKHGFSLSFLFFLHSV
ncbi:unnamed protein product [Staurois parvus]|uniref:Uncharacterized protein n=1 Tax=Staurois parvus TaxID=386267 RepID=A0ABN9FLE9_9NEOB|nr:unnamed protein product [Staurois parvus]